MKSVSSDPSHNGALSETYIINHLCNCRDVNMLWCFVHNKVNTENMLSVEKNNNFGFMPHTSIPTPLFLPSQVIESDTLIDWAFKAHQMVATTNCPNYRGARIRVPNELNINNWRALCGNYEDQLLLDYLEFGFPLCVDRNQFKFNTDVVNHSSATLFPSDIDKYFEKEIKHKAIVGPCHNIPFVTHYSPLLSRPKPDDTRRVIVNLSAPYGNSVNDCIAKDVYDNVPFTLSYPLVDNIIEAIQDLDYDVMLSKIDISCAFRNFPVDPGDFDLLGLKWKDNTYLDISIPMGMKSGSALCQRTIDVLRHIMASKNVKVFKYLDDTICVHRRRDTDAEFDVLYSLFEFLGIPINPKKVVPPSTNLICMGIEIEVQACRITIPQEKLLQVLDLCSMYKNKIWFTKINCKVS